MKIDVKISKEADRITRGLRRFERTFLQNIAKKSKNANFLIKNQIQYSMKRGDWPANAEKYLNWKRSHGYSSSPLFRTNLLYNSISTEIKWGNNSVKGQIGWNEGARYPGDLQNKQWKGRVPNRRKKDLSAPSGMLGYPMTSHDTNYLAQVAEWNEKGTEGIYKSSTVTKTMRNGFRKAKNGEMKQRFRTKSYEKLITVQSGRPPRPFVARSTEAACEIVEVAFMAAIRDSLETVFKSVQKKTSGVAESAVPF